MNKPDLYHYRKNARRDNEYFKGHPAILAVYAILVAFERHYHEGLPLTEVQKIYYAEHPKLGKYLKHQLRAATEPFFQRDIPLTPEEYKVVMDRWSGLRGYLEDGRTIMPYIVLIILMAMLAAFTVWAYLDRPH
jgi:hypothetical protein